MSKVPLGLLLFLGICASCVLGEGESEGDTKDYGHQAPNLLTNPSRWTFKEKQNLIETSTVPTLPSRSLNQVNVSFMLLIQEIFSLFSVYLLK